MKSSSLGNISPAMTTPKPTVLLIPGAWHQGSTFEPVANILRAQGYEAETITLPSAGGPASTTTYDDAEYIQNTYLKPLVGQEKEVVLVMHSYAGVPGTECVRGFARKYITAQGKKGGVISLIYQAAFVVPSGASIESFVPGGLDTFMTLEVSAIPYPTLQFAKRKEKELERIIVLTCPERQNVSQGPKGEILQRPGR